MLFCNSSTPKTETSTQQEVETITPTPNQNDKDHEKNKITQFTTTTTTITLYFAGSTVTVTTTNSKGETISYATYIPPSTVLVVKKVAVTADANDPAETISDSTVLYDFNSHGLCGVLMSLVVVATTLIFMIFA
jgi:hypothetical protein